MRKIIGLIQLNVAIAILLAKVIYSMLPLMLTVLIVGALWKML